MGNSWTLAFGGTCMFLSAFLNPTFTLTFTDADLGLDVFCKPVGTVTGIKISIKTPVGPLDIADITELNVTDLGAFMVDAKRPTQASLISLTPT